MLVAWWSQGMLEQMSVGCLVESRSVGAKEC